MVMGVLYLMLTSWPQAQNIELPCNKTNVAWVLKYNSLQMWHAYSAKKCSCLLPTEPWLIHILSYSLSAEWCYVLYTALLHLQKQRDILLIGDDSDLVCLSPLSDIGLKRIYFHTEPKWNIKVLRSYWDRLQVQQDFGKHINKHKLFVHAISSCDTHT